MFFRLTRIFLFDFPKRVSMTSDTNFAIDWQRCRSDDAAPTFERRSGSVGAAFIGKGFFID
jgi:hypothetical protein